MKSFLAALAFLTRLPAGRIAAIDAADVAHSAGWFPLIGLLLGAIYSLAAILLKDHLPFGVVAVLLVMLDALATGAGVSKVSGGIVCYGCGISYVRLDGRDSILLDEVKTNVPIDEAKFGRPASLKKR